VKIYMLSKYLKKAAAVMSSVMIFSFAIQAVSPSFVAKADSVSTQTTASAQEQQEAQAKQLTLNLLASSGKSVANLLDDAYTSKVSFAAGDTLTVSADEPMQGVYLKWASLESSYSVSYNGKEQKITKEDMLHKYIDFGETVTECTITFESAASVCDIFAYGKGKLPDNVQVWEKPCTDADILVFSTHADDEILFLGGVLATYAGQQGLNVQVAYMTNYWNGATVREHEKLDGLWESGVKHYPVNGEFDDIYATDLNGAMSVYSYDDVLGYVTEQIRRFKPLVVVTQDINGEYGHGGHMLLAKAVCEAADNSGTASFKQESADKYGAWDVPKTYIHLYGENKIRMDLRQPLSNMKSRTAIDVAKDAYLQHVSQQWCWFYVSDEYEYSCADFGLYRSTVGTDTGNDMLENVTTYEEKKRIEEESKAAEESSKQEESLKTAEKEEIREQKAAKKRNVVPVIIIAVLVVVLAAAGVVYHNYMEKMRRKKRRKNRGKNGSHRGNTR